MGKQDEDGLGALRAMPVLLGAAIVGVGAWALWIKPTNPPPNPAPAPQAMDMRPVRLVGLRSLGPGHLVIKTYEDGLTVYSTDWVTDTDVALVAAPPPGPKKRSRCLP